MAFRNRNLVLNVAFNCKDRMSPQAGGSGAPWALGGKECMTYALNLIGPQQIGAKQELPDLDMSL